MTTRIKLVGAKRFAIGMRGEVFEKGFVYELDDKKAAELLAKETDAGMPFFVRVEAKPVDEEMVVTSVEQKEVGGVKITRTRGKPKADPKVKKGGEVTPLLDQDDELRAFSKQAEADAETEADAGEGVDV